jgi:hypothetical protein
MYQTSKTRENARRERSNETKWATCMLPKHHGKNGNLHLRAKWPPWSEHFACEKYSLFLTLFS